MNQIQHSSNTVLRSAALACVLALGACSMAPKGPSTIDLAARLYGSSEVPPVMTAGSGSATLSLNSSTSVLTWTVTYSDLSGPPTAGHFHGPALIGQNGGVVVPLSGSLESPITGSATLTPAQVADMTGGKWYLNLHTAAHPGGEIRGQVIARP